MSRPCTENQISVRDVYYARDSFLRVSEPAKSQRQSKIFCTHIFISYEILDVEEIDPSLVLAQVPVVLQAPPQMPIAKVFLDPSHEGHDERERDGQAKGIT